MIGFGDSITYGAYASDVTVTAYAPLLATALGLGLTNYGIAGATLLGYPPEGRTAILDQMLAIAPPTRYETCVMIVGTNDAGVHGTDAPSLASFSAGLQTGLLHLTANRRTAEPEDARERLLVRGGKRLPTIVDGCSVFVGNMPRQSAGFWAGIGSAAAHTAYVNATAAVAAAVAGLGRRVYLVDLTAAYDPDTMSSDPPSNVHPNDTGHAAIKAAFYAAIQAAP